MKNLFKINRALVAKKKFFLSLAVFVMALCANAQMNQYFWFNGNLMMGNPIAQIDSVTFGEDEPADTLHILLPRTIIKTVEVHDTVYITIHDTICPNEKPSIEASKTEYLWIETKEEFLIDWNNDYCNIDYSFDKVNWTTAVATSANNIETFTVVPANTKIYLRGVNGANNSFWGSDWWPSIRMTTKYIYNNSTDPFAPDLHHMSIEMTCGGNILSVVFGDDFVEKKDDVVYSTLAKICSSWLITDASLLYVAPASYGTNNGWLYGYGGDQGELFGFCYNLKKGPYIKFLKRATFKECVYLTDIYYIGDGSEISNQSSEIWYNDETSSNVETLTIHVKPGVSIPVKPTNAIVVEDLE